MAVRQRQSRGVEFCIVFGAIFVNCGCTRRVRTGHLSSPQLVSADASPPETGTDVDGSPSQVEELDASPPEESEKVFGAWKCSSMITAFSTELYQYIHLFTEPPCAVTFQDLDGEALNEAGIAKMCGKQECLTQDELDAVPDGKDEIEAACKDAGSVTLLEAILPLYRIAQGLHRARADCDPYAALPQNNASALQDTCLRPGMVAHNCGYTGEMISEGECLRRDCCWDPRPERHGRNWCFRKASQVQCQSACPSEERWQPPQREDCEPFLIADKVIRNHPDPHVRGDACQKVGCCWDPLDDDSDEPWCFYKPCLAT